MTRKAAAIAVFAAASLVLSGASFGGEQISSEKAKLMELREKKALTMIEHEEEIHKMNKEYEDKMAKIRQEYRSAHDACLKEKWGRAREMNEAFEAKLRPVLQEEEALVKALGPDETNNFAKTRVEKERAK